jgi:succinoglycan biosynthesis transport protein ExoP
MGFKSAIKALWRRKWILLLVPLATMLVVFVVRLFGDWKYTSTAQIATGITTNRKLANAEDRLSPEDLDIEFNNLITLIKSPQIIGQVSYLLMQHDIPTSSLTFRHPSARDISDQVGINLLAYEEDFRRILDKKIETRTFLDPAASEDERLLQELIVVFGYDNKSILDNLYVARMGNTDYVELKFTSENPDLSAMVVNEICKELMRYYAGVQPAQSNVSLDALAEAVVQRKKELDQKLVRLQEFRSENEVINSDVESISRLNQISSIESQIETERQKQRTLELNLASLDVRIQDGEAGAAGRLNDEVVRTRQRITSFNERYVRGGQTDQKLLDSITALRSRLDELLRRMEQAPKYSPDELRALRERRDQVALDLQVTRENIASLTRKLNGLKTNIVNLADREATRKLLEDELELAREQYLLAENRFAEAKQKLNANKLAISQVMYGEPASRPHIRSAVILVGASGVVSFLLCALFVLIKEFGDPRIRTAARLKSVTRIPTVGIVPELPKSVRNPSWNFFLDAQSPDLARLNEYLRKLRFNIEGTNARVLLVTSTKKAQGKTFIVMALAYAFSLARKRTLIIDTNLRHNSLTRSLTARVHLRQSIEQYNNSVRQLTAGKAIDTPQSGGGSLISTTYNEFVDVIGNKTSHLSPSEVIPVDDFRTLLKWLRNRYDYIILEGSSLNDYSDTRELAHFADLVIPVFSADSAITDEDRESLHFLRALNGQLGPAILNRVSAEERSMAAAL